MSICLHRRLETLSPICWVHSIEITNNPFAILAWKEVLGKKEVKWFLVFLAVPIYLYTWNFILNNQAPIPDWAPYL